MGGPHGGLLLGGAHGGLLVPEDGSFLVLLLVGSLLFWSACFLLHPGGTFYSLKKYIVAFAYLFLSKDMKWKMGYPIKYIEPSSGARVIRKKLIFIRHGESTVPGSPAILSNHPAHPFPKCSSAPWAARMTAPAMARRIDVERNLQPGRVKEIPATPLCLVASVHLPSQTHNRGFLPGCTSCSSRCWSGRRWLPRRTCC